MDSKPMNSQAEHGEVGKHPVDDEPSRAELAVERNQEELAQEGKCNLSARRLSDSYDLKMGMVYSRERKK